MPSPPIAAPRAGAATLPVPAPRTSLARRDGLAQQLADVRNTPPPVPAPRGPAPAPVPEPRKQGYVLLPKVGDDAARRSACRPRCASWTGFGSVEVSAYPGNIEVGDVFDDGRHHKAVPVGPDREPVPASHVRQTFRPGRDIDDLSPR